MDTMNWLKQLTEAQVCGAFLLCGEEEYLKQRALNKMQGLVINDAVAMLDLQVIEGKEATNGRILEALAQLPVLSLRRMVVVRDDPRFAGKAAEDTAALLKEAAPYLEQDAVLVFYQTGKVAANLSSYKAMNKGGMVLNFEPLDSRGAAVWIVDMARQAGGQLDRTTAVYLADYTALSLEALSQEVAKLAAFAGDRPITREDIEQLSPPSAEVKVFKMIDDLWAGRKAQALAAYRSMVEGGTAPMMILSLLASHIRIYRMVLPSGLDAETAAGLLGARAFAVRNALRSRCRWSPEALNALAERCAEADWQIKQGVCSERAAVDQVIDSLTAG